MPETATTAASTATTPVLSAGGDSGQATPAVDTKASGKPSEPILSDGGAAAVDAKVGNDAKPEPGKEGAAAKTADPGEFKIALPEGFVADETQLAAFTAAAKDAGLTSEQASKVAVWDIARQKQAADLAVKQWEAQDDKWKAEIAGDAEIGGDKLNESVVAAKRALRAFGGEAVVKVINEYGLGNHPELVRTFARMGRAMGEDKSVSSRSKDAGPLTERERLARFYNKSQPNS
jgi:hypothetical protein